MAKRDFLTLLDCTQEELGGLIERASELKRLHQGGAIHQPLAGKTAALILTMNSTRTRVGFEAGMHQLGGHAIFLGPNDTQIGRGEPVEDMSRVLSGMVDLAMIRTASHADNHQSGQ